MSHVETKRAMVRVPPGTWTVDPIHSSVGFKIKHMMIATVRGQVSEFEGTIVAAEDDPANSHAMGTVKVASIDTGNADRDAHLRSPDFSTLSTTLTSRSSPRGSATSTAAPSRWRGTSPSGT